jgi:Na+-translocating ferredoxin:NAD+ oxidoreductase subunit E
VGLRETCARCATVCYERNPVIANMLGLCPLLAITDSAATGVIFGGFFVCVLCFAVVAVPPLRYFVGATFRPLLYQLALSIIVAAIGVWLISAFYATVAPYGVYIALVAANCLILDTVQHRSAADSFAAVTLDTLMTAGGIWISLAVFGAIREILANGTVLLDVAAGTTTAKINFGAVPFAGSPAGALILLGLFIAGVNAARSFAPTTGEAVSILAEAEPAP